MGKFKNLVFRYVMLFMCIGLVASISNCTSDDDDDIIVETFLEKYDGTTWKLIEEDEVAYMRINDNLDKPIEIWTSIIDFEKGLAYDDCFYYTDNLLNMEEMEIVENTAEKLTFSYLGNETWSFTAEEDRLKLEMTYSDDPKEIIYMDKTTDDVDNLELCSEE